MKTFTAISYQDEGSWLVINIIPTKCLGWVLVNMN